MANFRAIGATSAALVGLIRDHYPREDFGSTLEVRLYQAGDFSAPMREGFSIFLYRIAINGSVRNRTVRRSADGHRFRPSLPLDLYYLITPWAEDAERHHRMLGWAMRFMEDQGVLSAGHLNHYVAESDTFEESEGLELICDPLTLVDYLTLWDRLRPRFPLSAAYTLRMLPVDSRIPLDAGPPVQSRTFKVVEPV
jgi:hypothetical protein